jgi:adenine C2-methylase RlmN of 23S rRNA A2503 and tRNA A37
VLEPLTLPTGYTVLLLLAEGAVKLSTASVYASFDERDGASGYEEMTNLPAPLRIRLDAKVPFSTLAVEHESLAKDGTLKVLFRTRDGHPVEAVLMRYRDGRRSLCLSSQSGCPLTCSFCATGLNVGVNEVAMKDIDDAVEDLALAEAILKKAVAGDPAAGVRT